MNRAVLLPVLFLGVSCFSVRAVANESGSWQPEFIMPGQQAYLQTTDILRFRLPADLPVSVLQKLALEVDGIDVTSFIQREGDDAVYQPPQPLSYGFHKIRLVEYAQDGQIIERGLWEVEVRKNSMFREAGLSYAGTAKVSQRIGEHNMKRPRPDKTQTSGALTINGQLSNNDWQSNLNLPIIYDSSRRKKELDVGDFRLDWQQNKVSAVIGHQLAGKDSLIMSGFNRRGVSMGFDDQETGMSVRGFAVRGTAITGHTHGLGVGDSDDRVEGASAKFYPLREQGRVVEISGTYLYGKTPERAQAASGDTQSNEGDAWTIAADSLFMNNRLRLRGEYAATSYDFDGKGGNSDENDKAYSLLATYQPWAEKMMGDTSVSWVYGLEHRYVGTFFRSPASLGTTADRQMERLFTDLYLGNLQISAQWAQEHDNVDNLNGIPRVRTRLGLVNMGYSPAVQYDEQGMPDMGWLGQQNYNFSFSRQSRKTSKGKTASDFVDTLTLAAQLAATFNYSSWNWGISHNWTSIDDDSLVSSKKTNNSSLNNSTTLSASFILFDNYTISPRLTRDAVRMHDWDYSEYSFERGVDLSAVIIPDKLSAQLSYNMNHSWRNYDSTVTYSYEDNDIYTEQTVLNITWQATKASKNRPALSFSVDASYNTVDDQVNSANDTSDYQVFFSMRIDGAGTF